MGRPVELLPPGRATPDHGEWHELRRRGVAASEIAAVLGISPWQSPFGLWWAKREGWSADESEEMRTGRLVEPAVADWWAAEHDPHENLVLDPGGLLAHPERLWQLATPDRLVTYDTTACVPLECKWTGSWQGWGEPGSDDIPAYYRAQLLWQCDVLEVDQWYLAVLGPSGFRAYEGRLGRTDRADLVMMRQRASAFLDSLDADQPPEVDDGHPATIDALKQLHPLGELDIEVSAEFAEGLRRARALRKRAQQLCDRYEARARALLGSKGKRLMCGRRLVVSRSVYERKPYFVEARTIDKLNYGRSDHYG